LEVFSWQKEEDLPQEGKHQPEEEGEEDKNFSTKINKKISFFLFLK